jgi:hypothetical protein
MFVYFFWRKTVLVLIIRKTHLSLHVHARTHMHSHTHARARTHTHTQKKGFFKTLASNTLKVPNKVFST